MWETWVWSLGREDPLEKKMVTHSSILAYRIPWTEKSGRLQFTGSPRVGHDWATSLSLSFTLQENFPQKKKNWICMFRVSISSVQSLSRVRLFATPWSAARQASLSITNSRSSLRLTSIESVMPFSHVILCRPLLLPPPIPPSIRVFPNESTLAVQGTLKSLLQHHSSKASVLPCSAFFTVQPSHPCMTTGKIIALTRLRVSILYLKTPGH